MWDLLKSSIATGGIQLASIVSGVLAARLLLPEGRGDLALLILWPSILTTVGYLSLDQSIAYHVASRRARADVVMASGLFLAVLSAALTLAVGLAILPHLNRQLDQETAALSRIYFIAITPLHFLGVTGLAYLQGKLHFDRWNLIRVLQPWSYLIGILVVFAAGAATVSGFMYAMLVAGAAATVVTWILVARDANWRYRPDWPLLAAMLRYVSKVHGAAMLTVAFTRLDQLMIAYLLSSREMGLYIAMVALAGAASLLTGTIVSVAFPKISAQANAFSKATLIGRYLRFSLCVSALIGLVVVASGSGLVSLLFGPSFLPGVDIIALLAAAAIINSCKAVLIMGFKAADHIRPVIYSGVVDVAISAPLMLLLTPLWGLPGIAAGLLTSHIVSFGILAVTFSRIFGVPLFLIFMPSAEDWNSAGQVSRQVRKIFVGRKA